MNIDSSNERCDQVIPERELFETMNNRSTEWGLVGIVYIGQCGRPI